ncbi:MAG: TRAP transporter small permease [Synergistaceae bacterium]|jgi:C4-dicarboxylate transporter DctQ subunit|nr:TRAP transporter small permease [Synergistaceae bacterium]
MFLNRLDSGVHTVNSINNVLLVAAIVGMFFLLMLQVFARFLFYFTMVWADDVIVFLLISSVFLGSGTATAADKHIRLEFFISYFREETVRILLIIADIVSISFLAVICFQTAGLGRQALQTTVGASPVPLGFYYWVVGFGCLVMLLNFAVVLLKRLKRLPIGEKAAIYEDEDPMEGKRGENRA